MSPTLSVSRCDQAPPGAGPAITPIGLTNSNARLKRTASYNTARTGLNPQLDLDKLWSLCKTTAARATYELMTLSGAKVMSCQLRCTRYTALTRRATFGCPEAKSDWHRPTVRAWDRER